MQCADAVDLWLIRDVCEVEAEADVNVLLREVVLMDQYLADLVGDVGVFTIFGVIVFNQEIVVAVLRRMTKVYVDGLFPDEEYHRQKRLLEMELESLVVPQVSAVEEAGKLLRELPKLWAKSNLEEKRKLLLSVLDGVYLDAKKTKLIISIKPKPPFIPVFQVAVLRERSTIQLYQQTSQFSELAMGRVSGGGGGGLNSPSRRRLPERTTGLVSSFISPD